MAGKTATKTTKKTEVKVEDNKKIQELESKFEKAMAMIETLSNALEESKKQPIVVNNTSSKYDPSEMIEIIQLMDGGTDLVLKDITSKAEINFGRLEGMGSKTFLRLDDLKRLVTNSSYRKYFEQLAIVITDPKAVDLVGLRKWYNKYNIELKDFTEILSLELEEMKKRIEGLSPRLKEAVVVMMIEGIREGKAECNDMQKITYLNGLATSLLSFFGDPINIQNLALKSE